MEKDVELPMAVDSNVSDKQWAMYHSITQLFGVRQKGIAPHSETCWYNFSKESQQVGVTTQQSRVCALFEGTQATIWSQDLSSILRCLS